MQASIVDWGLWYDFNTVYRCYTFWTLSGYTVLPSAGGVLDQDWRLLEDMMTLQRVEMYHKHNNRVEADAPSKITQLSWG